MTRYKIQSKEDPKKTKYITSSDYKLGDIITFKWHKEWIVTKILDPKSRRSMVN